MIFLVQFGINKHLRARAILLVFEKFTRYFYSKLHSKSCDYLYKNYV